MNKLIRRISGYGDYTRGYAQTHVFKVGVHKVFQWVLFVATLVTVYEHKGGPCFQMTSYLSVKSVILDIGY